MTASILPADFALQSTDGPRIAQSLRQDRGLVCLIEAGRYPSTGIITVEALRPSRYYQLIGLLEGYCRTDARGAAAIAVTLTGPSLLVLAGVIA
ncbi:hypothetical protein [Sphingomonas sp.]|uniref:hypothetical protein n=1 Tax=Sphingomonas sp. TaxID=28214 RepID=UPI003B3B0E91